MKKNILVFFTTVLISLVLAEVVLRKCFAIVPGVHTYSQWFNEVDSLKLIHGFYSDSNGIFKVEPDVAEYLVNCIDNRSFDNIPPPLSDFSGEISCLCRDYSKLNDQAFNNEFAVCLRNVESKPEKDRDEFEQELIHYSMHPINEDGFRSISFKNYNTSRKKILLLGDSFAWGHSTANKTSSFADILLSKGYIVYNTGISGADVSQYLAIAQQYIQSLNPDYVVVNFFMGNDISYAPRPVIPFHPIFFSTNAGNLYTCPNGIYFDNAQQVYDFIVADYKIPQETITGKICSLTATGTLFWEALAKRNVVNNTPTRYRKYWQEVHKLESKKPLSNEQLQQIQKLCKNNQAKFILLAIPELKETGLNSPTDIPYLFEGIKYYSPPVTTDDYDAANGHYNESGHKKQAAFIDELIKTNHYSD